MTEILFARKTDVDSLIISIAAANGAVRYDIAQSLTAPQQAQALANLGGVSTITLTGVVTGSGAGGTIATAFAPSPVFTGTLSVTSTTVSNGASIISASKNWTGVSPTNLMATFTAYNDQSRFVIQRANGTAASTTATIAGDLIGQLGFRGYFVTGGPGFSNTQATIAATAIDTYTSTTQGTQLDVFTTASGTTTLANVVRFQGSGGVSIGSGVVATDPGAGNLLVQNFLNTGGHLRVTTDLGKANSVTLSAITGLSATLVAGKTYSFIGTLYTVSNVAGGIQLSLSTSTATITNLVCEAQVTDGAAIKQQTRQSTLSTIVNFTAITAARIDINGTITVNAAGTFALSFAQNVSNAGNTTVLQGSWMKIWLVT